MEIDEAMGILIGNGGGSQRVKESRRRSYKTFTAVALTDNQLAALEAKTVGLFV